MKESDYHLKKAFSANKELHWSNCKRLRNTIRMHKEKSDYQSGVSLNLRTGPTAHATLFNQWEGALVFINKQIKTSPKHRHSNQKFPNNVRSRTESVMVSGSQAYFEDFSWGIHNFFMWTAYRKPIWIQYRDPYNLCDNWKQSGQAGCGCNLSYMDLVFYPQYPDSPLVLLLK